MNKICKTCNEIKPLSCFEKGKAHKDGYRNTCKECVSTRVKLRARTPEGRIAYLYSQQAGRSKIRGHSAPLHTQNELLKWAYDNGLIPLYESWKKSGYLKDLAPSVDRLNANMGYSLTNIRLVTWAENKEKGFEDIKSCSHKIKRHRPVEQLTMTGEHVAFFKSIALAVKNTGARQSHISSMCSGDTRFKSVKGFIWRFTD